MIELSTRKWAAIKKTAQIVQPNVSKAEKLKAKINELNELLHQYSEYVIGRMGIPYREKSINIICIAIDAPQDKINSLTGALGKLDGISAKVAYSKN